MFCMLGTKKRRKSGIGIYIIGYLLLIVFFVVGTNRIGESSGKNATESLREIVRKTAVHCYAVEGRYPKDMEYMEKNYGLRYNHEKFTVHYQVIGQNLMPDIFIVGSDTP